ncbi:hypothetical protein SLEP1_g22244 [Rubroshorea leprosula]|uniref:Uncharacterized protein n=1 Tax=Rubroshorea leprosula TaxID=152421 RepID=A0AAV5JJ41_9ROSI|nr:hypothetical protein SLEP1_g22244 [Rubroshorea leprosula]
MIGNRKESIEEYEAILTTYHPSSTCFRWSFLPLMDLLACPHSSSVVNKAPLIFPHSPLKTVQLREEKIGVSLDQKM